MNAIISWLSKSIDLISYEQTNEDGSTKCFRFSAKRWGLLIIFSTFLTLYICQ